MNVCVFVRNKKLQPVLVHVSMETYCAPDSHAPNQSPRSEQGGRIGESAPVELLELIGADHMDPLTHSSPHWNTLICRVISML